MFNSWQFIFPYKTTNAGHGRRRSKRLGAILSVALCHRSNWLAGYTTKSRGYVMAGHLPPSSLHHMLVNCAQNKWPQC